MNTSSVIQLLVAILATVITALVSYGVLRDRKFSAPGLAAGAIGGMTFLALDRGGDGVTSVVLVPYGALGLSLLLSCLALVLIRLLARLRRHLRSQREPLDRRLRAEGCGNRPGEALIRPGHGPVDNHHETPEALWLGDNE